MRILIFLFLAAGAWAQVVSGLFPANRLARKTFSALGTPTDGAVAYCADCARVSPCAGAGTGAMARREAGAWNCSGGTGGGSGTSGLAALVGGPGIFLVDTGVDVTIEIDDTFVPTLDAANVFAALQTMPGANLALATDPPSPSPGDIWYAVDLAKWRAREGGTTKDVISAPGGGTASWTSTFFCGTQPTPASTTYCGPYGFTSTEGAARAISPIAGTLKNLRVLTALYSNPNLTCTLRKNGVSTTLVVSWPIDTVAGTLFSDTTHTAAVAAGDAVGLMCVNPTGLSGPFVTWQVTVE